MYTWRVWTSFATNYPVQPKVFFFFWENFTLLQTKMSPHNATTTILNMNLGRKREIEISERKRKKKVCELCNGYNTASTVSPTYMSVSWTLLYLKELHTMIGHKHNFTVVCPNKTKNCSIFAFAALGVLHWIQPICTNEVNKLLKMETGN